MNKIVRENYPVEKLPDDLKDGLLEDTVVRVTIEPNADDDSLDDLLKKPDRVPTLDELFAMRRPPYKTTEQIVDEIRRMCEEWDD